MFCIVSPSDLSKIWTWNIGARWHESALQLRCQSENRHFVDCRLCIDIIWHHLDSYFYTKHPDIINLWVYEIKIITWKLHDIYTCAFMNYSAGLWLNYYLFFFHSLPWLPTRVWQSDDIGDKMLQCGIIQTHWQPMTQPRGEHIDRTYMHKASQDVEQTRYPVYDVSVYCTKTIPDVNEASYPMAIPLYEVEPNNGKWMWFYCCFGDCWMLVYKNLTCIIWQKW